MTKPDHAPGYVPNEAYTQEDWDEVCDTPELTDAEIAQLRPAAEVLPPDLYAALVNKGGRPKSEAKAVPVSLRVPPDVLAAYKATGPGWQPRRTRPWLPACGGAPTPSDRRCGAALTRADPAAWAR